MRLDVEVENYIVDSISYKINSEMEIESILTPWRVKNQLVGYKIFEVNGTFIGEFNKENQPETKLTLEVEVKNYQTDYVQYRYESNEELESILDSWKKENKLLGYKFLALNGSTIEEYDANDCLI